jgi:hypothetical protein
MQFYFIIANDYNVAYLQNNHKSGILRLIGISASVIFDQSSAEFDALKQRALQSFNFGAIQSTIPNRVS